MRRPYFAFYPSDWRDDTALQLCSLPARGLWWEMICLMHKAEPYGHLIAAGAPVTLAGLSRLVGAEQKDVTRWLDELEQAGVFSRNADGAIYSRRMLRDDAERKAWRARQGKHRSKKGGGDDDDGNADQHAEEVPPEIQLIPPDETSESDIGVTSRDCHAVVTPDVTSMSPRLAFAFALKEKAVQEIGRREPRQPHQRAPPNRPTKPKNGVHSARGTRLPEDWRLPEEWRDWATRVHHVDPQRATRISLSFRDYWIAKAGRGATKLDWQATWRLWIRKEVGDA